MATTKLPDAPDDGEIPGDRADELVRTLDVMITALTVAGAKECAGILRIARDDVVEARRFINLPF